MTRETQTDEASTSQPRQQTISVPCGPNDEIQLRITIDLVRRPASASGATTAAATTGGKAQTLGSDPGSQIDKPPGDPTLGTHF